MVESAPLTTSDGHHLEGDLARPAGAPIGGVVVCHPHPQFGGNRFNHVVDALFAALPAAGFTTLRFDFRREHADGVGERLDVIAALDALSRSTGAPVFVAGYSFGAAVALNTLDPRIRAIAAVAPPLAMMTAPAPSVPTLLLVARHDQFTPPDVVAVSTTAWARSTLEVVESADHFLSGQASGVADRVTRWLVGVL